MRKSSTTERCLHSDGRPPAESVSNAWGFSRAALLEWLTVAEEQSG